MATWSIQVFGALTIERGGEPYRPRIIHQGLLLARLCAHHPEPISRSETAELLWPDASREHASAYLRRALMELRKAGLDIATKGDLLSLEGNDVDCDLFQLMSSPSGTVWTLRPESALDGIEHPIAEEIRRIVASHAHRLSTGSAGVEISKHDPAVQNLLVGLGEYAVDAEPAMAFEFLAANRATTVTLSQPDAVFTLAQRLLSNLHEESAATLHVRIMVARIARIKTIYFTADRLLKEALELSQAIGDQEISVRAYYEFSLLRMEQRDWESAREMAAKGLVAALDLNEPGLLSKAYNVVAGVEWQIGEYQRAVETFLLAYERSTLDHERGYVIGNLAYLWGVLGIDFELPDYQPKQEGQGNYEMVSNSYRLFATHYGKSDFEGAARYAAILIEVTGRNNMDRMTCVALDCAGIAFRALKKPFLAAACVRLSTRLRRQVNHSRSRMERDSIRLRAPGPFFGKEIAASEKELRSDDLAVVGERVSKLLRTYAKA